VLHASAKKKEIFKFFLDSTSTEHIISMEAACLLFDQSASEFKLLGVSRIPTSADTEGNLILTVLHERKQYIIDFGK
jgi:hypothetical protein